VKVEEKVPVAPVTCKQEQTEVGEQEMEVTKDEKEGADAMDTDTLFEADNMPRSYDWDLDDVSSLSEFSDLESDVFSDSTPPFLEAVQAAEKWNEAHHGQRISSSLEASIHPPEHSSRLPSPPPSPRSPSPAPPSVAYSVWDNHEDEATNDIIAEVLGSQDAPLQTDLGNAFIAESIGFWDESDDLDRQRNDGNLLTSWRLPFPVAGSKQGYNGYSCKTGAFRSGTREVSKQMMLVRADVFDGDRSNTQLFLQVFHTCGTRCQQSPAKSSPCTTISRHIHLARHAASALLVIHVKYTTTFPPIQPRAFPRFFEHFPGLIFTSSYLFHWCGRGVDGVRDCFLWKGGVVRFSGGNWISRTFRGFFFWFEFALYTPL